MPPRASLKTFLATARAALTAPRTTPLTFVVGNESADLDSLCSALLLAYFHTYAPAARLHIPICNLHRPDLALRPEFTAVLRDAGVRGSDMLTLDDVLPRPSLHAGDTRWLLVDHNAMTGALGAKFASRVVGCVDHHVDEHVVPRAADIRVVETSGSCASLVLHHCRAVWDGLATEETRDVDAQIARVALACVLVDTANLRDRDKTTAFDERAVEFAEGKIRAAAAAGVESESVSASASDNGYERTGFYERLLALKEDLTEMSLRDVWRKDYKEWRVNGLALGTSASPRGFGYLLREKAGDDIVAFESALGNWGDEAGKLDLVVVLTGFGEGTGVFRRELLVWARSVAGVRAARLFVERNRDLLALEAWEGGRLDLGGDGEEVVQWRRCWAQGAVKYSRKQIAPMLREALQEVSS